MDTSSTRMKLVINGRFIAQRLSGVQRYSREIVSAMDRLIQSDPIRLGRHRWELLLPPGVESDLALSAIHVRNVGGGSGHIWEQRDLAREVKGARLINLGNSGPLLHRDKLVVIHDAAVFRTPANFSARYRLAHCALSWALARTGAIATVSEFSRGELSQVLGVREQAILVVRNGSDHLARREQDAKILAKLGVQEGRYFLFVGSPAPNKNLRTLLKAFVGLDRAGARLVVAGSLDRSVFGGGGAPEQSGVILAQGCSDGEIAALYAHATAHVFPSLYEGFGIPPLEAMASGCPVIASDIPVIREVCGGAAEYFPPNDADALTSLLRRHWDVPQRSPVRLKAAADRVARFRWEDSARTLVEAVVAPQRRTS